MKLVRLALLPLAAAFALTVSAASSPRLVVGVSDQHLDVDHNILEVCYADAFIKAGYVPIVIPCTSNEAVLASIVSKIDLLVLSGGADVETKRYRTPRAPKCGDPDLVRDEFEFRLVAEARKRRLPIVGVCRGCQLLNVAFGGTLWQDLPSEFTNHVEGLSHGFGSYLHPDRFPSAHTLRIVPGTRLASAIGTKELAFNSHHHQAVKDIAPGFVVAARAPDGVIEAIEGTDYPAFGIQGHPEALVARAEHSPHYDFPRLLKLIRAFPYLASEAKADK